MVELSTGGEAELHVDFSWRHTTGGLRAAENGVDHQGRLPFILDVWPQPTNQRTHLRSASLSIDLVVTASNADAKRYTVVVHFDGHFKADSAGHAGRVWDHLTVVPPSKA